MLDPVVHFIQKPFSMMELAAKVRIVLVGPSGIKKDMDMTKQILDLQKENDDLKAVNALLETIIQGSRDAIFIVDNTARFHFVNKAASKLTGYTKEELLEMRIPDLHAPENLDAFNQFFDWIINGKSLTTKADILHKNGTKIPTEFSNTSVTISGNKYVHTIAREIIDTLQTEKLLLESEDRFQHMVEGAPEPIFIQTQMKFAYLNPAACRLFGISSPAVLVGKPVMERFHPDYHEAVKKRIVCLNRDRKAVHTFLEQKILRIDGSEVWVETVGEPIVYESHNGALVFARDITERKQMEERIQQSQKMEAMGTLAGGIAHDFNNILFSIIGHSEMLLEKFQKNNSTRQDLYEIYTSALRAMDLVKQILTFSRREKYHLTLMKLQPIIKEALKLIRSTIPATISITRQIQSDCGLIKADPTQIHQLVMNLATNAYHAMEQNGGTLSITLKQVVWNKDKMKNLEMPPGVYACLSVADTGTGMDEKILEKVFDPFFTTKKRGKGTGMGLSVVYGIVKNMGGTIQVHSKPGYGSRFHVYLPVVDKEEKNAKRPNETNPIPGGTEKILLVDDEESVIDMETRILSKLGYDIVPHTSSVQALQAFAHDPGTFDIVITDLAMPDMPGDQLAAEVLKIRPDIPILLCTGFSEHLNEKKITSMGIRGYSLKPILIRDLAEKIRSILDG